ncbi:AAA family ATPase [Desulfuromonas acetexigens]|uniref:AAA family ATPase n=1 Tax=Trichloromonas acetexigens TaxID=38815 RepID=A0A550JGE0_9BACT|nr:AAA family ATPase [Desulfuromonas acetexigens]TRO82251.1 AAA family ATPase [Desulfuromonas acetexigens]
MSDSRSKDKLAHREAVVGVIDTLAERYLRGKIQAIRLAMIGLLADGHILLEDIPGLGKTTLALALARVLGLDFGRIQCTSDLLPSDITGLSIFDREQGQFKFVPGPIFSNLLLVDEINRAMPRTQSALLEAMEEGRVTVEGVTYPLPEPFMVVATQNPVEQVGTYPLPESQLDRFSLCTGIGYPPEAVEKSIIRSGGIREQLRELQPLISHEQILEAKAAVRDQVYLSEKVTDYLFSLIAATRESPLILSGISTRGGLTLAAAAKAAAYLDGRDHVLPEDVKTVALAGGAHRLILRPEQETLGKREVLKSLLQKIPVPRS